MIPLLKLPIPTYVVTGTLGIGKTSLIVRMLEQRPAQERWAVVVNEFGNVSIDDALLAEGQDRSQVSVSSMPGGCLCCSSSLPMDEVIPQVIEQIQPHRLIVEPSGLAHMGDMLELLQRPPLSAYVSLFRVITMMNPKGVLSQHFPMTDALQIMIDTADDILLAKADRFDLEKLNAAKSKLTGLLSKPALTHTSLRDFLESNWQAQSTGQGGHAKHLSLKHGHPLQHKHTEPTQPEHPGSYPSADGRACGWLFYDATDFDKERLNIWITRYSAEFRIKGVLRIDGKWTSLNCMEDERSFNPSSTYQGLPRLEMIALNHRPDWTVIQRELETLKK